MGEAKRRAAAIARQIQETTAWRAGLNEDEQAIVQLAERLEERLVRGLGFTEGCYHLAFFMTRYLAHQGISVTPIIGWVNDGTWDGVASHAWIEYNGLKTDVSMTKTSRPDAQPPGHMIILDRVVKKGRASYTYYTNDSRYALHETAKQRADVQMGAMQGQLDARHKQMMHIAEPGQLQRIDAYLNNAPAGLTYPELKRLVEQ